VEVSIHEVAPESISWPPEAYSPVKIVNRRIINRNRLRKLNIKIIYLITAKIYDKRGISNFFILFFIVTPILTGYITLFILLFDL